MSTYWYHMGIYMYIYVLYVYNLAAEEPPNQKIQNFHNSPKRDLPTEISIYIILGIHIGAKDGKKLKKHRAAFFLKRIS